MGPGPHNLNRGARINIKAEPKTEKPEKFIIRLNPKTYHPNPFWDVEIDQQIAETSGVYARLAEIAEQHHIRVSEVSNRYLAIFPYIQRIRED